MELKEIIIKKNNNRSSVIGIIGLGYVGMPLSLSFINSRFKVIGFDIDVNKISKINKKKSYISSISSKDIKKAFSKGFKVTSDFSKIRSVDVIILCVPTPLNKNNKPELKYLTSSINSIIPYIKKGQLISLESTTYPGTTEEEIVSRLEKNDFKIGKDIFVCYSPEREDPGNIKYSTKTIPKVIGAYSQNCLKVAVSIYSKCIKKLFQLALLK